eukprot:5553898-Pyramimonas_sp.AAC.1
MDLCPPSAVRRDGHRLSPAGPRGARGLAMFLAPRTRPSDVDLPARGHIARMGFPGGRRYRGMSSPTATPRG